MALKDDPLMQGDALRVLREHVDAMKHYLGSHKQYEPRNRRLAVLNTIRDLEKTHGVKLTAKDALLLLAMHLPPLKSATHSLHLKHFFDHFRHLSKENRSARARALKQQDDEWAKKTDQTKRDQIRSYIKANSFPDNISIEDVVQVASRNNLDLYS